MTTYTISNNSNTGYIVDGLVIKANGSVQTDHLTDNLLAVIRANASLTLSPFYTQSYNTPFPDSFDYTDTGVDVSALTTYPALTGGGINTSLARAVTLVDKNLDALSASVVEIQTATGVLQSQINDLQTKIDTKLRCVNTSSTSTTIPTTTTEDEDPGNLLMTSSGLLLLTSNDEYIVFNP